MKIRYFPNDPNLHTTEYIWYYCTHFGEQKNLNDVEHQTIQVSGTQVYICIRKFTELWSTVIVTGMDQ